MTGPGCEAVRELAGACLAGAGRCPLFSENWAGELHRHESLAPLTTLRVGGPAAVTARPASLEQLQELLVMLKRRQCPWRVLGRGSNLLVADRGYAGVAVVLGRRLAGIELLAGSTGATYKTADASSLVRVEAGRSLASLLNWSAVQGLGGLEFLAGIPGSIGGAATMNAGAFGQSLGERVVALELVSAAGTRTAERSREGLGAEIATERKTVEAEKVEPATKISFTYRRLQGVASDEVVGAVILALEPRSPAEIKEIARRYLAKRRAGQPRGVANAGSFFKNPPGDYAGRLIEAAGLKGLRMGRAEVSPVHANFLVNRGGARAAELLALATRVRQRVQEESGVWLEMEVHLLGF